MLNDSLFIYEIFLIELQLIKTNINCAIKILWIENAVCLLQQNTFFHICSIQNIKFDKIILILILNIVDESTSIYSSMYL